MNFVGILDTYVDLFETYIVDEFDPDMRDEVRRHIKDARTRMDDHWQAEYLSILSEGNINLVRRMMQQGITP